MENGVSRHFDWLQLQTCIKWCILLGVGVGLRVMQNSFVYSPSRQLSMLSTETQKVVRSIT